MLSGEKTRFIRLNIGLSSQAVQSNNFSHARLGYSLKVGFPNVFFSYLVFRSRSLAKASLAVFLFSAVTFANAQGCASPGLDGPVSLTGVINSYHAGVGTASGGANQIIVAFITGQRSSSRELVAGDLILLMQMQDSASPASAGQYEYAQIASVAGTLLTLDRPLTNT